MATKAKQKTWKYPIGCIVKKDGVTVLSVATQLYEIGVYVCATHGSSHDQLSLTPAQAIRYMKQFQPNNLKEGYTSEFSRTITVKENERGFYEEVKL